jgi:NAD+ kinase
MIGVRGQDFEQLCENSDLLVSIGGDGTLISLARRSYRYEKPILGINAGKLGFLTDLLPEEVEGFIDDIFNGEFRIDERMMIASTLKRGIGEKHFFAFNDLVVTKNTTSTMVSVKVTVDGKHLNTYYGDGLIISTPTGSTAYNLSVGGPIVYPLTKSFIISPICPHSLTQRPMVVPADFSIELEVLSEGSVIVIDGQEVYDFHPSDKVHLTTAQTGAKLLHRNERNYFKILRTKLGWGNEG